MHGPCKVESVYACIRVFSDGPYGRMLKLDTVTNSHVDIRNPKRLEFAYAKVIGFVVDTLRSRAEPISALHIGGGAFTLPRFLRDSAGVDQHSDGDRSRGR